MVSPKFWSSLNRGWPEGLQKPTDKEAITGVKRMVRFITGRPWPGKVQVVRGKHRHTWAYYGTLNVAPDAWHYGGIGWPAIVHGLSHYLHRRQNRGAKPHDSRQARLEKELQRFVIEKL